MDNFTQLKKEITSYLQAAIPLDGLCIVDEFPQRYKQFPLKDSYIAVGIGAVQLPGASGEFSCPAGLINITLRFDILCPQSQGELSCHHLFDRVCESFFFRENNFGVQSIECSETSFDASLSSLRLTATAKLTGRMTAALQEAQTSLSDIVIVTKGV